MGERQRMMDAGSELEQAVQQIVAAGQAYRAEPCGDAAGERTTTTSTHAGGKE
ncbi:MAG: hypothetical protein NZ840_09085 [Anaerolineales bacterium]|nr:hypothetical protein [Anaerolineales bacterium]MDW8162195.1 hypothetical protein [Anaerolineales bacterium]